MKKIIFPIAIVALTMMQSCAIMISGSKQDVVFETNAPKAKVYANFDYVGDSNEEFKLYRKDIPKMYTLKADGCRDTTFLIEDNFNPWCYSDVLIPYNLAFDYALGVQHKTQDTIKVEMDCGDSTEVDYD